MFYILRLLYDKLQKFDREHRDLRSEHYFLAGSPFQVLSLIFGYYVFVKYLGPRLMHNREAFDLKIPMLIYNALQVIVNTYFLIRAFYDMFWNIGFQMVCSMPAMDDSTLGREELFLVYSYFLIKLFDYFDTIFMVLRKRFNQVSFLHVYHHMLLSLGTFVSVRYMPGGHSMGMGLPNVAVHAVMYSYYFLSALNPNLKNSLWWKKHLTQIQIVQFLCDCVYFSLPIVLSGCDFPKLFSLLILIQAIVMTVLFADFYKRAYLTKTVKKI